MRPSLGIGWLLPYTGFAGLTGFEKLTADVLFVIIGLVILYLFCAELVKRFIYHWLQRRVH